MISTISLYPNMLPYIFGVKHDGINFNLGGPLNGDFEYYEKNGEHLYQANFSSNDGFIVGLWKKISLITAVVGKNGTGKTSILKAIKNNDLLAVDESKNIISTLDNLIIYYSPFLSYDDERDEGGNVINISKYSQLKEDLKGDELSVPSLLNVHNSEFIKRLIVLTFNVGVYTKLIALGLPEIDLIKVKLIKVKEDNWNVSREFIPFFEELNKIRNKEKIEREEYYINKFGITRDNVKTNKEYKKESYKIRLEHEIINCIILKIKRILNRTGNDYLEEGYVNEFANVQNYKEAFYLFLENAYVALAKTSKTFLPVETVKNFTDKLISIIAKQEDFNDWTEFSIDRQDGYEFIELYNLMILSFKKDFTFDDYPILEFSTDKELSTGEKSMLEIFALMNQVKMNIDKDIIENKSSFDKYLILLDEADIGFHPTWKKKYINLLVNIIPEIFIGKEVQIIFTTHDPLTLSDIPATNIIFLDKENNKTVLVDRKTKNTFGANIADLLSDSFFVEDGLIGDFAKSKIEEIIIWVNENRNKKYRDTEFFTKLEYYKKIIEIVDERILKVKLSEMISELEGNIEFRKRVILKEIDNLNNQLNSL